MRKVILSAIALVGFALALVPAAFSQATTGNILGVVSDSSGAVIVGATATAKNEATGLTQSSETDATGFVLRNLPPGKYTVTVTKSGFKKVSHGGVLLLIDQQLALNFELPTGSVTESVTVTGEAPILQTHSVETGEVIQAKQIVDLPLDGRNFLELASLTAGVAPGNGGNTLNLAVNGQREFANSVLIDGVEATGNRNNDTGLSPSVDAVEEFKVATSAYSAQYGRAAGGVISIQTKAGTNGWHGSGYEFYRPSVTAAEDYGFGKPGTPSQLSHNNFGGTFGGPIVKDKTFFFVSYEQFRSRSPFSYTASVPPTNQIVFLPNGDVDLSNLVDPATGNQIPIFDPAVNFGAYGQDALQFDGNIIPASSVSTAGRAILQNFFPAPNLPADGPNDGFGWFNNFQVRNVPDDYNSRNGDVRVDHTISSKDRLAVVYHYGDFNSLLGDPFWNAIPVRGGGDTDQAGTNDSRGQELSVTETHFFSNRLLNEFRFGFSRFRLDQLSLLYGKNLADQYGAQNVNLPGFSSTTGFPYIYLGTGYVTGGSTYKPLFFSDNNFQFSDNLTLSQVSKHEFKMGVDFRRLNAHPLFSLFPTGFQYYAGPYIYSPFGPASADPTYGAVPPYYYDTSAAYPNGGSDIADLLLGVPQSAQIGLQLTTPHTQSWELHLYGEDVWKVNQRLTLTYGVRYEFQNPFTEANNNVSNYDQGTNTILIAGRGGNSNALINARKNNFSPRVGFAYQMSPRTVLRAGYGLFYTPENDARSELLTKSYPFAVQQIFFNYSYNGLPYQYGLDSGVQRITEIPIGTDVSRIDPGPIPDGAKQTIFYVDPHLKTGYSQLFNVTLQRELTPSLSLEAAYVGSLAHDLPYAIGNINLGNRLTDKLGQIEAQQSLGWAKFNSLQLKANKRLSGNLSFLVAYTYGHSIDNGPAPFNLGKGHNQPQNPFDLRAETASSDNDFRHNLVVSSLYHLPIGKGQWLFGNWSGARQTILGGWQMNVIVKARTGLPVNVVQDGRKTGLEGLRPNVVGNPNFDRSERTLHKYFNTDAFCIPAPSNDCPDLGPGGFGNAGRNVVRGPGYINADYSLFKDFAVKETMKLQLRFEFFNLTNTPHFNNPGGDLSDKTSFGQIRSAGKQRVVQFAGKFLF